MKLDESRLIDTYFTSVSHTADHHDGCSIVTCTPSITSQLGSHLGHDATMTSAAYRQ